jgi:hypothetical protein
MQSCCHIWWFEEGAVRKLCFQDEVETILRGWPPSLYEASVLYSRTTKIDIETH